MNSSISSPFTTIEIQKSLSPKYLSRRHPLFDLLVSNYWAKFVSRFLVAHASRLQKMPSSKLVQPPLSMNPVLESWRSLLHNFMHVEGLKCWWPFQWDNGSLAYCACCDTSDLPVTMRKVIATSHCISQLCFIMSARGLCKPCIRACHCLLSVTKWW